MLGFNKYGGRELDGREEVVAVEGDDDIGMVVEAEEKAEDEEWGGRCPFPVAGCLSNSVPAEGNIV